MNPTKSIRRLIAFLALVPMACYSFSLPPDFEKALTTALVGEPGGLFLVVENYDRGEFDRYIRKHWREISDHVESLPKGATRISPEENENAALEYTQFNFAVACEVLPPTEYLEFMEKWIGLYEEGKISYQAMEAGTGEFTEKRRKFLAVNWEHPRIQALYPRLVAAASKDAGTMKESQIHFLKLVFSGKLADSYRNNLNEGEDLPFPDTLPGIKLKRPFNPSETSERMWRDYEKRWDAEQRALARREGREARNPSEPGTAEDSPEAPTGSRIPWIAGLLLLAATSLAFLWRKLARN